MPSLFKPPLILVLFATAVLSTSCGNPSPQNASVLVGGADTGCLAGQATIGLFDASLRSFCGCAEGDQTLSASANGTLACTVPVGTTVFFQSVATVLPHQVFSTGTPGFVSSPILRPRKPHIEKFHGYQFTQPGTYTYRDSFTPGLNGVIVVQ
jgi:hypothetical protein